MTALALVTGASSGIGYALSKALSAEGISVLAVARRADRLAQLAAEASSPIIPLCADITSTQGQARIVSAVKTEGTLQYIVHNAGVVSPLGKLSQTDLQGFRAMLAVNVEAPLAITQQLLPFFSGADNRILHLSSGAAHTPFEHIGGYCVTKAAFFMIYQLLREELAGSAIHVGSVMPGIIETAMTDRIISDLSHAEYTGSAWMENLRVQQNMLKPEKVARFLAWLLLHVPAAIFSEKEWDVYDKSHHNAWWDKGERFPMPDF